MTCNATASREWGIYQADTFHFSLVRCVHALSHPRGGMNPPCIVHQSAGPWLGLVILSGTCARHAPSQMWMA